MNLFSRFPGAKVFAAALATIAGLLVSIPSQALTVTLSGTSTNSCTYTAINVAAGGDVTVTCASASGQGTLAWVGAPYTVAAAGGQTTATLSRTGGTTGTVTADILASGNCTVSGSPVNWAAGDANNKLLTITGGAAGACTLTIQSVTSGVGGAGSVANISVAGAGQPGTFSFSGSTSAVNAGTNTTVTILRSGGSTGTYDVAYTATPTGLTGQSLAPGSPVRFNDGQTSATITMNPGTTAGTLAFAFGAVTPVSPTVTATTASGTHTVTVSASSGGPGNCAAPPAGTITSGVAFPNMGSWIQPAPASGQIVAIPLPNFQVTNGFTFTTTVISSSQLATSPVEPFSATMVISPCPGEMVGMGPNCARTYTNRSGDEIKFATYDPVYNKTKTQAENYGYCWIAPGTQPNTLFLNLRYNYSACGYAYQTCGFSLQWNIYDGFAHNP